MTSTESTTRHANQTPDHSRELERAITDALILAVGKRAADRALRHARARNHPVRQRTLVHVAGHLAGYGALISYIWYQRRTARESAGA
jgi:ferric-dicitrate binding protein FerR (iron transport regulator)